MYSPKINEDLIPQIYRAAKSQKIPMTRWVNRVLTQALGQNSEDPASSHVGGNAVVSNDSKILTDRSE